MSLCSPCRRNLDKKGSKVRNKLFLKRMRVCALISGGKDSIFALHCVVASGHDVVCLGHIAPSCGGEPDSEMYQSVATEGIKTVSEALEIPVIIQDTRS